jgi:hypothetical protein
MNKSSFLSISYSLPFIFLLCATIGISACTPIDNFISTPTSTPTEADMVVAALQKYYHHHPFRDNQEICEQAVIEDKLESCLSVSSIDRLNRPEWEQLLPDTHFYLLRTVFYSQISYEEEPDIDYEHFALQNGQLYTADTFDDLLDINNIRVTDENRELIAKTFALMTLADHLKDEVVFTGWEAGEWPQAAYPYNYCLIAWTKIQGLELEWCFVFKDDYLSIATGSSAIDSEVGDYIELDYMIPRVRFKDYCFEDYCS